MKCFPTTVGIEYTVIPKNMSVANSCSLYNDFGDWAANEGSKYKVKLHDSEGFKYEEGAWEISSKPLKSFREVKIFYDSVRNVYKAFGKKYKVKLVANSEYTTKTGKKIYLEGGGGHLHLGQPQNLSAEELRRFNANLFINVLNNPSLHWIMSDWCDNDILLSSFIHAFGAKWKVKIVELKSELVHALIHKYPLCDWGYGPIQMRSAPKFDSIKFNSVLPTHEFRFFGAPIDYQNLVDNINLALKIWEDTFRNLYEEKSLFYPSVSDIKNFCDSEHYRRFIIEDFDNYLNIIGLNPQKYKRYHKNLDLRIKYGNLYTNRLPV